MCHRVLHRPAYHLLRSPGRKLEEPWGKHTETRCGAFHPTPDVQRRLEHATRTLWRPKSAASSTAVHNEERKVFTAPGCDGVITVCLINSEMQNSPNETELSYRWRNR